MATRRPADKAPAQAPKVAAQKATTPARVRPTSRPNAAKRPPPQDLQKGADPETQVAHFLDLLDALAEEGTPETKRIRSQLINVVEEYRLGKAKDVVAARTLVAQKLLHLEGELFALLVRSTTRLRDRLVKDSRKLGTKGPGAEPLRAAAQGMDMIVDALTKMQTAVQTNDEKLRDQASALMQQARAKFVVPGAPS